MLTDHELQHRHEDVPPSYYDEGIRGNILQRMWHDRRRPVVEQFLTNRNGRLLDLGCHAGWLTNEIARVSRAAVTGIDLSAEAIAYARRRAPQLTFVVGDLQQPLPFPNASFETVTAFDVLEHVPRLEQLLEEVRRVLVPHGALVIGVPNDTVLFRVVWSIWTRLRGSVWRDVHVHNFTSDRLIETARRHQFTERRRQISHWGMYLAVELERQP